MENLIGKLKPSDRTEELPVKTSVTVVDGQTHGRVAMVHKGTEVARAGFRFNPKTGELIVGDVTCRFQVKRSHSGQGLGVRVGRELLQLAKRNLPVKDIREVSLTTTVDNEPMKVTAARLGFKPKNQRDKRGKKLQDGRELVHYKLDPETLRGGDR